MPLKTLSAADVKYDLENLHQNLTLQETEDTWEKIAKSITSLIKIFENGGYEAAPSELVNALRTSHRNIISAMNSERTRLCLIPLELLGTVSTAMGGEFEQLLPMFMPPLLALCGRTNKIVINRARASIFTIVENTQLASLLSYFLQNVKDKSASLKLVVADGTLACLNSCNPPDIEKDARAVEVEAIIRVTAHDANADVRKVGRKIFESYKILLPSRVQNFTAPLSPTTKKYLDIRTAAITTQKSVSNLRAQVYLKQETKPSSSATVSTSTARPGHSRTASSSTTKSTTSQTRNAPTTMTRVSRKEPTAAAPYVPVRPVQPARVIQDTKTTIQDTKTTNPQRTVSTTAPMTRPASSQESRRPIPPLRSQVSATTLSRATGTGGTTLGVPHRVQLNSGNPSAAVAPVTTGPRRVPMPPPPVPPAPTKEKDASKRPPSRVDNATSSSGQPSRPVVPPAPVKKKPISTLSSSLKGRVPATNPGKSNPTTSTTTAAGPSSVAPSAAPKPLAVAKSKPLWGRSVPPAKPVPTTKLSTAAVQKVPPKAVVKKGSSKVGFVPKPASKASTSQSRPITPAMIALPPSPTPEDQPETKAVDELQGPEVQKEAEGETLETEPAAQEETPITALTPDVEVAGVEEVNDETVEVSEPTEVAISPSEDKKANQDRDEEVDAKPTPSSLFATITNQDPKTPQGLIPKPSNNIHASKTPISALLNSIERGFIYSPITPLSPADSYLPNINGATPYSHQTHAPHIQGPMQPFNYALHAHAHVQPQRSVYAGFGYSEGLKEENMIRGDIGVVKVDHNSLFMPSSLPGLDDGSRLAFLELNH